MSIRNVVRTAITVFVLILLSVVAMGVTWTTQHQPTALRLASHIVLGVSALAGLYALSRIWNTPASSGRRPHAG